MSLEHFEFLVNNKRIDCLEVHAYIQYLKRSTPLVNTVYSEETL